MASRYFTAPHVTPATLPRLHPLRLFGAIASLYRQRRALAELDDRLLDDIGVTKTQARREAERPVWDVPQHWLQHR